MERAMNLCKSLPVWVKATELVLCRDSLQWALRYVQGRERDESGDMVIAEGLIHGVDEERLRANQFFIEEIEMYVCGGGGEGVRQREKRERKGGGERERETGRESYRMCHHCSVQRNIHTPCCRQSRTHTQFHCPRTYTAPNTSLHSSTGINSR